MSESYKKMQIVCFLFLCILPAAFIFTFEKSLWLDEAALALNVLDKSFLELFQPLQYAQSAPPAFLCLAKVLVSVFGPGEQVLRFIPFFFGAASIVAFWFLAEEVFRPCDDFVSEKMPLAPFFGTAIFAFSFPFLYNTLEFKPYTADILFTILTFLIWLKILRHNVSVKKEVLFTLLLSLFPLFSFGSIFPLCAVCVLCFPLKGVNEGKERKIIPSILGVSFILYYIFIFSKINSGTSVYKYWVSYFINHDFLKGLTIFFDILKYHFFPSPLAGFALVFFILGFVYLCKNREEVFSVFYVTLFCALAASFYKYYPLYGRLSLFLYPVFLVTVLSPIGFLGEPNVRRKFAAVFAGLFILSTVFYNPFNDRLYKREEIKPLLLALQKEFQPGDRIFVFKGAHLTWRYYAKTRFRKTLGAAQANVFVCPYNATPGACAKEIEPFCTVALNRGNSCYVIYSSEVDRNINMRALDNTVGDSAVKMRKKTGGKLILEDKNSALYKISPPKRR